MHRTVEEKRRKLGWDEAWTFSVVRNPYSRAVSQFKHWRFYTQSPVDPGAFLDWLGLFYVEERRPCPYGGNLWLPQSEWLRGGVDEVFYFENIGSAWEEIQRRLNIQANLPRLGRAGDRTAWKNLYDERHVDVVETVFARDFERFDYERIT